MRTMSLNEFTDLQCSLDLPFDILFAGNGCAVLWGGGRDEVYDSLSIVALDENKNVIEREDPEDDNFCPVYLDWEDLEIGRKK